MARLPIPPSLKRVLVPLWNEAHRMGWLVRDHAAATLSGRWECCTVCGRFRPMLYRLRVIPPKLVELWGLSPRLAQALARKESCNCAGCGAKLRARRMAEVLLLLSTPSGCLLLRRGPCSIGPVSDQARGLRIAEINRIEGLHEALERLPALRYSDFTPEAPPGSVQNGVRSEDLTRLTYPDASFDLVLTSESLEHVPDLERALREIHRVLVSGGRHLCTVPILPGTARTYTRVRLRPDGSIEQLAAAICHPGGDVGYPVFTELGVDFPQLVAAVGFEVETCFGPITDDDLAQVYVWRKTSAT